ncbi:molybdate ABC transporter substrate-binding protein [Oceanidesulfovibrio marinus]|uniref:ABC transporter substrate-binding protein n=1 Tax=Oceanidesulfovibrio marinus TaxID=370038 RepID=A0ABX6NI63_9BACT|nr:substrate-binding domain-containing protein [Oceanidesulfovibrio marinus]QJT10267.1 ABC transporter substrate-binding protein [Oceanidesulfovibrio marinus]
MHEPPIIPDEREGDLLGFELRHNPDLAVFLAGNQFMAAPHILKAFAAERPDLARIYCETLPPGLELRQILAGSAVFRGEILTVRPDFYAPVSQKGVDAVVQAGLADRDACKPYVHNRIVLLVPAGNPRNIAGPADLAREGVRVSQPDAAIEDIGIHIRAMYEKAGGAALAARILEDKVRAGETYVTTVHHRETPQRLLDGEADVGPVWATEAAHARDRGLALEMVDPGPELDMHEVVAYMACPLRGGGNPEGGLAFARFLRSATAREIYSRFGFIPA